MRCAADHHVNAAGCGYRLRRGILGITSACLQGIDDAEIIETVHARRAPTVPVRLKHGH